MWPRVRNRAHARRGTALETLIAAAGQTRFYRPWLLGAARCAEEWLRQGPVVSVRDVYEHRDAFRNGTAEPDLSVFRYPIQPAPPSVVLTTGFRAESNVHVMPNWRHLELRRVAGTAALAAPVEVLRCLAAEHRCELRYPVVAFTGPCHGLLSDSDRDLIWSSFGVPVYEQFLGVRNELLAEDCDAHGGLHVLPDRARFETERDELLITSLANLTYPVLRLASGLYGRTEESVCACGRSGLKLVDLKPMPWALAATA